MNTQSPPRHPNPRTTAWISGATAFALYAALAPRVAGSGDSAELSLALATGGIPHPTGYPLYTLAGHVFVTTLRMFGAGWAHAANLWSALGAGLAIGLFAGLAIDVARSAARVPGDAGGQDASDAGTAAPPMPSLPAMLGAASATMLLAFHPAWLASATMAEVYAWDLAWTAAAWWLALRIAGRIEARGPAVGDAAAFGFVAGVGLAHHLASAFVAAPLGVALRIVSTHRRGAGLAAARPGGECPADAAGSEAARAGSLRPAHLAVAFAAALLPLSSYGFVAARAFRPVDGQWPLLESSWASVWTHVSGGAYAGRYLGSFAPTPEQAALLDSTLWPALVPGLVLLAGLVAAGRPSRARPLAVAILAGAVLRAGFVRMYGVPDPAAHLVPALAAALLALPIAGAMRPARIPAAAVAIAVLLPLALVPGWWRRASDERARVIAVEARIRELWRSIPIERGVVFWQDDRLELLRGWQLLDGERPGLLLANPAMLTWPAPRAAFERRVGIDPLAGLALVDDRDLARIPAHVARRTGLPVVDFGAMARGEPQPLR